MLAAVGLIKTIVRKLLNCVPISVLQKVEDVIQQELGKGSGAWSTAEEATAISKLVKNIDLSQVVVVDAGANLGDWSAEVIALIPNAQIYAFEPSKIAFGKLSQRFQGEVDVKCFNLALGKSSSKSTLYSDVSGSGLGSLTKRRLDHFDISFNHQEEVTVETLDDFFTKNYPGVKPNVLKMDVEGHELEVLRGALKSLETINLVQFEFGGSNIDTRTYFQDFWYFFKGINFDVYRLLPTGPMLITRYSEQDETFRATNYIALRKIDSLRV
jgi:FkbM family methyltransferase